MMDRLLTAGLCGNTIGQDIQMLTYHSSTSNMAFHGSAFAAGQAPVRLLALKISVIFGHTDKSSLIHLSNL